MIHNLSIDSHIFVAVVNDSAAMEEERGTHDMCAVMTISIDDDDEKEEEEVTNMIAVLISGGDLFIDMIIAD